MKEYIATITKRGQLTLPAEVRRTLNLGPEDKVVFVIENEKVTVRPAEFTARTVFSSVELLDNNINVEEAIRVAKEERIGRAIQKLEPS